MVVPDESLRQSANSALTGVGDVHIQVGRLGEALAGADLAITKSGTVTLECAFFGVPAVVFYVTSRLTYEIAKRVVRVPYLAMPNLLAKETLYPEFVQDAATPENLSRAALGLLDNQARREHIQKRLSDIVKTLGERGASRRAAQAILQLTLKTAVE
jgi:lipid-A-disaccharide synthase